MDIESTYNTFANFLVKYELKDGPPFRSGDSLHFGHVLVSDLKDIIIRFFSLVDKPGNDCHGLPIEIFVERLGIKPNREFKREFIEKCIETINSFSEPWYKIFDMIGRNFDKGNQYFTMDTNYMESEWWAFKQLYEKNLVYTSFKIMPYSTGCKTPISNFEADNFKEVNTDTLYVKFKITDPKYESTSVVAWTTTPWTLPMNLALCVNPDLDYNIISYNNENFIVISTFNNKKLFKDKFTIVKTIKGSELKNVTYESLYNYYEGSFKIIADTFVTSDSGTGIVHLAPGFGEEDLTACLKNNIVTMDNIIQYCPIDESGKYTNMIADKEGLYVFDCNDLIYKELKEKNHILLKETIKHQYPYCARTDTPLIYKLEKGIYIKVTDIKEDLVNNYRKTMWVPQKCGNRFEDWIKNAKDWCVSRNRIFGTPIPIFTNGIETICIGSIDELVEKAKLTERPTDLHLHSIEHIVIESESGPLRLVPYVFDCWFDSAVSVFASEHYPFKNPNLFDDKEYLSGLVLEGIDQTRGWFYTLMVVSIAIFNRPAFKHVICTGLVQASDGTKFSKSKGNCIPIKPIIEKYSSDALRIYLSSSPASNGESFRFDEKEINDVYKMLHQYANSFNFFNDYLEKFKNSGITFDKDYYIKSNVLRNNVMDKWILSRTESLNTLIKHMMCTFSFTKLWDILYRYIEDLTNWYIAFNRYRFKGLTYDLDDQHCALSTLYQAFTQSITTFEPFMPFLSEKYKVQKKSFQVESEIENSMTYLQIVVDSVRKLRVDTICKSIKMPLQSIAILNPDINACNSLRTMEEYLKRELNCDTILYPTFEDYVTTKLIANAKTIGMKYKKDATTIKNFINNFIPTINLLEDLQKSYPDITEEDFKVTYELKQKANSDANKGFIVIIDPTQTEKTTAIYKKRLLIAKLQKMRKTAGLKSATIITVYHDISIQDIIDNNRVELETQIGCTFKPHEDVAPDYEEDITIMDNTYKFSFVY